MTANPSSQASHSVCLEDLHTHSTPKVFSFFSPFFFFLSLFFPFFPFLSPAISLPRERKIKITSRVGLNWKLQNDFEITFEMHEKLFRAGYFLLARAASSISLSSSSPSANLFIFPRFFFIQKKDGGNVSLNNQSSHNFWCGQYFPDENSRSFYRAS